MLWRASRSRHSCPDFDGNSLNDQLADLYARYEELQREKPEIADTESLDAQIRAAAEKLASRKADTLYLTANRRLVAKFAAVCPGIPYSSVASYPGKWNSCGRIRLVSELGILRCQCVPAPGCEQ